MDLKSAAKVIALDVWICSHFKVLPTEERFLKLGDRQKLLLFYGFTENPTDSIIWEGYRTVSKAEEFKLTDKIAEQLSKIGYGSNQITNIRENLKRAGL